MRTRFFGQSTAELAFAAPFFILMFLGMVEYGRALMVQHVMTNAAREGAHLGSLSNVDSSKVQTTVNNFLNSGGLDTAQARVTISGVNAASGGQCVVTITYPYRSIILQLIHFSSDSVTLTADSSMVHE